MSKILQCNAAVIATNQLIIKKEVICSLHLGALLVHNVFIVHGGMGVHYRH